MKTKFKVDQKVYLNPLSCWGVIIGIYIDRSGAMYHCRWFNGFVTVKDYLYEDELCEKDNGLVGFSPKT